jgi:hypothetical protein
MWLHNFNFGFTKYAILLAAMHQCPRARESEGKTYYYAPIIPAKINATITPAPHNTSIYYAA